MFKSLSLKSLACLLVLSCFSSVPALAATTRNAAWGISFQNPAGWQIQLTPQGYALAQAQQQQMIRMCS
jgi:hypothetical protein